MADTPSSSFDEKAIFFAAVCVETGEVESMLVMGNTNAEISVLFLKQLRKNFSGTIIVIWDNGPAHRGDAMPKYLTTPDPEFAPGGFNSKQPGFQR